jgi:hypothetical protein
MGEQLWNKNPIELEEYRCEDEQKISGDTPRQDLKFSSLITAGGGTEAPSVAPSCKPDRHVRILAPSHNHENDVHLKPNLNQKIFSNCSNQTW